MSEALLKRWQAAWVRIIERLPPSDHAIAAELPPEAFGVELAPAQPLTSPLPPLASDQPVGR